MARKKSKRQNNGKGKRKTEEQPPIPDRREMEKTFSDIQKLLQEQQFGSIEEANVFLEGLMKSGEPFSAAPATPLQKAQELMYDAWDSTGKKRVRLARKALKISPDCADAYVLLAEEMARSLEEATELYRKGVQAGERAIGEEMFAEGAGHFWGILETRPYMRARAGLAQCLWLLGDRAVAIDHLQDMLRLNPGDNQGLRYTLSQWLLEERRDSELTELLNDYDEDAAADWAYIKALLAFRQSGPSSKAQLLLRSAIECNPFVPEYLLGYRDLPDQLPSYVGFGDESEAIGYSAEAAPLWVSTPGALDWIRATIDENKDTLPSSEPEASTIMERLFNLDTLADGLDDDDLEEDDYINEPDYPRFELEQFLSDLGFPKKEHASIRRGLGTGLEKYYYDIYGHHKYGKRPDFLIDERMQVPYIFGYGAVEILKNKRVSTASKLKICQYAIETIESDLENGVTHGLITLLGFMAAEDELPGQYFYKGILALEFGASGIFFRPIWMEGVTRDALIALMDWLGANEEITHEEELWWIWQLSIHCDGKPHLGKPLASHWLNKPEISDESKKLLCWGLLLDEEQVGEPPVVWLLMAAIMDGDLERIKEILENTGIDPEKVPLPELDNLPLQEEEGELDFLLELTRHRSYFLLTPPFLKRLAIPALVRLGEDIEEVAEMFWDSDRDYYRDVLNAGIADALEESQDQIAPAKMRQWIERGINCSSATTRKRFYALSAKYFGNEYMERALEDSAKSVRSWAAKKLS